MTADKPDLQAHILNLIVSGQLRPGDLVDESAITARFGVSKTPLREAVLRLEALDILQKRPRAGAAVARLDLPDLIELIEVHSELEGAAAYHAARRATPLQLSDLRQAATAYESAPPAQTYDRNLAFHFAVFTCANNATLSRMLDTTGVRLVAYFRAQESLRTGREQAVAEHDAIVTAISRGDADAARGAMRHHAEIASNTLLDILSLMR